MRQVSKRKWVLGGIIACLAILLGIYLFSSRGKGIGTPYRYRFTFVCPLTWSNIAAGLLQADAENGTNTKMVGTSVMDSEGFIEAIAEELLMKPDGIITAAAEDTEAFRQILGRASELGIPVVLVDSDLEGLHRLSYIGIDNVEIGRMAGLDLVKATGGEGKVAVIASSLDYPNQQERLNGFLEVLEGHPGLEVASVLECHSENLQILDKLSSLLDHRTDIRVVYIMEAIASMIVGDLLETGYADRDFTVVSVDNLEKARSFVERGTYYSTIAQDPQMAGYLAGTALYTYLRGGEVEERIFIEPYSIRRENLAETEGLFQVDIEWNLY